MGNELAHEFHAHRIGLPHWPRAGAQAYYQANAPTAGTFNSTENTVFMVFWMERGDDGTMVARSQEFGTEDMSGGLALMQALRARQLNGAEVRHITMSSENPDSVGRQGVDVVDEGYSWTKRRRNERPKS